MKVKKLRLGTFILGKNPNVSQRYPASCEAFPKNPCIDFKNLKK